MRYTSLRNMLGPEFQEALFNWKRLYSFKHINYTSNDNDWHKLEASVIFEIIRVPLVHP